MDLHGSIKGLLGQIGPGQQISRSAYDTAWVARLDELGEPMGEEALEWLRSHQLADGSWGTNDLRYHHERLVCTLAAMAALGRRGENRDRARLRRAQLALETSIQGLRSDPAGETIGFEMIVPTLVAEVERLGVIENHLGDDLARLSRYREAKLAALPGRMIDRSVTVAFSTEMVGLDGLHLLDVDRLREPNGSVAYSPAATTFFSLHVKCQDPAALAYLRGVAANGAAPYIAPIEIFEQAWTLWNLALLAPLDGEIWTLCQPHLDALAAEWQPGRGIAACKGLTLIESDTTSVAFKALAEFGRAVDLEAVLYYEEENHFRCFSLEANPSLSANIHVLDTLRAAGLGVEHPSVHKVIEFLRKTQTLQMFWFDKWHASPYYPTSHAIMACAGYFEELVDDAVYWILTSQNEDGSWGYYLRTAEETAYCLQALIIWKRAGGRVPTEAIKRAAAWLSDHADVDYPPLWIGKCLYSPVLVVRSAILTALAMAEREVGL
jgi:hypothetical protein